MDFNQLKSSSSSLQNNGGDRDAHKQGGRTQAIVESSAREVANKFNRLYQLIEQLNGEELNIRELMKKNCAELREEVDEMETKQRKVREMLQNFNTI